MKLFTIGDSISQGVMSGAAARTDLSYSSLIAKLLYGGDYAHAYPTVHWPQGGIPFNMETILRRLQQEWGAELSGTREWAQALASILAYIDEVEDCYERGAGSLQAALPQQPLHNVSVRGFDVAHSWLVHPGLAAAAIADSKTGDGIFSLPAEARLRVAHRVLASGMNSGQNSFTQLDWLQYHHRREGVENLFLWLGANNALGTVLDLKIRQTSTDGNLFSEGPGQFDYITRARAGWNLWHPLDFRAEYRYLMNRVQAIMQDNPCGTDWHVFVATIPLVTICPLIKAAGSSDARERVPVTEWPVDMENPAPASRSELREGVEQPCSYGRHYPYFLFAESFDESLPHLDIAQVLHIDNTIRAYNRIIQELVADANEACGSRRFWLVDIASCLSGLALKRNSYRPTYSLPEFFRSPDKTVDTRYFAADRNGERTAGGLFSLDGVHPTAIGQAIIAREFLKVMLKAGCFAGDPDKAIDWRQVATADSLFSQPPPIIGELYDVTPFKKWLMRLLSAVGNYRVLKKP
jgi:lysophospholipase L1-like esterase